MARSSKKTKTKPKSKKKKPDMTISRHRKSNTDDIVPVYDSKGNIKYWREKEPDGPGGWMPGMGLYPKV